MSLLANALEALIPDAEQLVGLLPPGAQRDAVQARIRAAREALAADKDDGQPS